MEDVRPGKDPETAVRDNVIDAEDVFSQGEEFDFAGGDIPARERESISLATEGWHFKRSQQGSVFSIVAAIAVLLYMTAGIFGAVIIYKAAGGMKTDWHIWLMSVSFLLPPTILCVALIRAVYPRPHDSKGDGDALRSVPAADFLRELVRTIKE